MGKAEILFDGTSCQLERPGHFHGGGEYAKFILERALDEGYRFEIVLYSHFFNDEKLDSLLSRMPAGTVHYVASKQELYGLIDSGGYCRFYTALPYGYYDYRCKAQFSGVIHGLRKVELPWNEYAWLGESRMPMRIAGRFFPGLMAKLVRSRTMGQFRKILGIPGARIITVSEHSKYSILNFFPDFPAERIDVFYSPFSVDGFTPAEVCGDYFLMLNGERFEKNVYKAVRVFDRLFSNGCLEGKAVVVTGCGRGDMEKMVKNKERFRFLPYVPSDELVRLHREAFCFVYPSLNEGFGYPPLMAMACGVPVVASSSTSIPEVCADAALYFSPENADDMANRILQVAGNAALRESLAGKGHRRVSEIVSRQQEALSPHLASIFAL